MKVYFITKSFKNSRKNKLRLEIYLVYIYIFLEIFVSVSFSDSERLPFFNATKKQIHSLLCIFPQHNTKKNQLGRNPQPRQSADARASPSAPCPGICVLNEKQILQPRSVESGCENKSAACTPESSLCDSSIKQPTRR